MVQVRKILFPTDFSDYSSHALTYAISFADLCKAEIHVLHIVDEAYQYWMAMGPGALPVGPPPDEILTLSQKEMEKFVASKLADVKSPVTKSVLVGRPFMEIIRYAREEKIDMIVMGTHGRSGLRHAILGSVTERVVRKATCPVLTIRSPAHEFVMP
ncbi:MAG: universal stress protein [Planctomycetes bacterium]|nr:universal stress protein [Planctomycetota bacterium]